MKKIKKILIIENDLVPEFSKSFSIARSFWPEGDISFLRNHPIIESIENMV